MFPITTLEFTIETQYPLDLGANPGASIRGALYEALATMYDTGAISTRDNPDNNPVDWLMRREDKTADGGDKVRRPFGVRPPMGAPSDRTIFALSFYGTGHDHIPMVLSAVDAMQTIGMGRGRNKFTLHEVVAVDTLSRQRTLIINGVGEQVAPLPTPPSAGAYQRFADMLNPNALTVEFKTPTRIIETREKETGGKEYLVKTPIFRAWVQRLLERIRKVSEEYTATPLFVPFSELKPLLASVLLVQDNTHWLENWSHNRRDGTDKPTSGFIGQARYEGNIAPLLPYLLMGQGLQVGKNVVKGAGWYELVYDWRTD
jgi:hypothetical protein